VSLTLFTFYVSASITARLLSFKMTQRVCRKSPFESVAISQGRRFLNQHPGVPFQLQLLLYFQAQFTSPCIPFEECLPYYLSGILPFSLMVMQI
jgi:hypothetical protein